MESSLPEPIRLNGAILLKNEIMANWAKFKLDPDTGKRERVYCPYSEGEQNFLRNHLIDAIAASPSPLRLQLGVVFSTVAYADFPAQWPNLLSLLRERLQSSEGTHVYAALFCLRLFYQKYEFQSSEQDLFNKIIEETFPVLSQVLENVHTSGGDNVFCAEIQLLLCKIFYSTIAYGVPPFLLREDELRRWMHIFVELYTRKVPLPQEKVSRTEVYQSNPWWKVKKWVGQIWNKLIRTHAEYDKTGVTSQFVEKFKQNFAAPIQGVILSELQSLTSGAFIPPRVIYYSFNFLSKAILLSNLYKTLAPHIPQLLEGVVFPVLYFDEEDEEIWNEDPEEYIRREHDILRDDFRPQSSALDFLYDLSTHRSQSHIFQFIQFIVNKLNAYQQAGGQGNFQEKYAALCVFNVLASKLKKLDNFKNNLEEFVAIHVLSEMSSPHGFLRARACWTFCLYADLEYKSADVFVQGLQRALACMQDSELPVRATAGIGLKFVVANPLAESYILPNLGQVLELFLRLQNEMDSDDLINALEFIIFKFQDHIQPHAVELVRNIWQSFLRIINQEEAEDTGLAALECLRAILVILTTIQENQDLYPQVEPLILPSLRSIINQGNMEYFEDFSRILSCFACYGPSISPALWEFVPLLYQQYETWAFDFLPNILIPFDNIITADPEGFARSGYFALLYKMAAKALSAPPSPFMEPLQISACQLLELAIQNCSGTGDQFVEGIIEMAMNRFPQPFSGVALPTVLFNLFGNLFLYNPALTMQVLAKRNIVSNFFGQWFQFFEQFSRVYDRKVTVLGLSSIFLLPTNQWPVEIQNSIRMILLSCIKLIHDANQLREEKALKKQNEEETNATFADEALVNVIRGHLSKKGSDDLLEEDNADCDIEARNNDLDDDLNDWLEEDPNELEDEDEVTTAIDGLNENVFFFDALKQFQAREQNLFNEIYNSLSTEEKEAMGRLSFLAEQQK